MTDPYGVVPPTFASSYLAGMKVVIDQLPLADVNAVIAVLAEAYQRRRRIFVLGNGGSAATASHMACDLGKTVLGAAQDNQIKRFSVWALTDNVPTITAWANDSSYDGVFSQQLRNLAEAGDLVIVISGSGNSPNIVDAARVARDLGLTSIGLLGFSGGAVKPLLDHTLVVSSNNFGYIEDAHMIIVHLVTAYFREAIRISNKPLEAQPLV